MEVGFLKFKGEGFLRLGIGDSYFWVLVFLRLGVRDSYVWGFCYRFWVEDSYIWVRDSFVWGLVFLRLVLGVVTFGG